MSTDTDMGVCPECEEVGNLKYGKTIEWSDDNEPTYLWDCPNCGAQGKEHYKVVFTEHEITLTQEDAQHKTCGICERWQTDKQSCYFGDRDWHGTKKWFNKKAGSNVNDCEDFRALKSEERG